MGRRIFKRVLVATVFFGLGAAAGIAVVFYTLSLSLPAIGPLLEGYNPPQTTRILAADGTVIGELFDERRTVVKLDAIPKQMIEAVIAAEDADFRRHGGIDYRAIARAALANLFSGRLAQGASTITQQVARTFFLTREKRFSRKIREILLTVRIEHRLTKDEILFLYLNQINFGHARYGVEEAARFYFNKPARQLTLPEAALLAGIPKGPALYSPILHPDAAKARRAYVLGEMAKLGKISRAEADAANAAPLGISDGRSFDTSLAPEAVARAVAEVGEAVDLKALRRGGYTIETTLDPDLQRATRAAVATGLEAIDKRQHRLGPYKPAGSWPEGDRGLGGVREGRTYVAEVTGSDDKEGRLLLRVGSAEGVVRIADAARYNPDRLPPSELAPPGTRLHVSLNGPPVAGRPLDLRLEEGPQAAVVVLGSEDGRIAALVGGDSVAASGFDRATAALRQPGSAFKPFVYLAALASRRYTPATVIDDAPEVFGDWQPKNTEEDAFAGAVLVREAVARSLNLPAVKVITDIGPERVAELAAQMGIGSKLEATPALALGASAVTPLELASAFAVLPARGAWHRPWIVKRIADANGVETPLAGRAARQVVAPEEAYVMTSLLRSVVEAGTGYGARKLDRPAAGKTGTSNEQRDAWFVGFTPDFTSAVWVGFDDFRPLGRKEFGGQTAVPIWVEVMKKAEERLPARDFEAPEGVVTARIDPRTGLLAYEGMEGAIDEVFIAGTEPTDTAVPPGLVSPDRFLFDQMESDAGLSP